MSTSIPRQTLGIGTLLTSQASPKCTGLDVSAATPAPDGRWPPSGGSFQSKNELTATNGAHCSRLNRTPFGSGGYAMPYRFIITNIASAQLAGLMRTPPRRQSLGLLP